MKPLTARERRILALGATVVAATVLWAGVWDPVVGGTLRRAEERSDLESRRDANERLASSMPFWRAAVAGLDKSAERMGVRAETRIQATEALKERVTRTIAETGGTSKDIRAIEEGVPERWVKIGIEVRVTLGQLTKALTRLESEAPYVVVDYLLVVADRSASMGHLEPLDVRLEVSVPFLSGKGTAEGPTGGGG